ncbi:hypothetical protein PHYSODRAFT_538565 [Phytophthora sojae]|uniref:Uncharacterized protein n=1 Tax=Phytophthora sojae (strain P6497) TaxID=1094619 RepID=G4YQY0_PHYSP|nr:hypothetical protein PHYSODRAFT_538565 [Phytophthora sojae]EGZ30608.1 hypothetical protein PHYSODRAFT_538565 [Phytophthora sojae]|eukprot:XP_009517883.1 hypothetical protein PHYSODRAFT_538565 [Phytophthora sojae]
MPCPAEVSVEPATLHTEKRLDSPRAFCTSPSSISDVDFSRSCNTDKQTSSSSDKTRSDAESGDEQEQAQDGMRALRAASGSVDINEALAHPVSSSQSLKRKADEEADGEQHHVIKKSKTELTPAEADSDYLPTDIEEDEEPYQPEVSRDGGYADEAYASGCVAMDSAADVECSSESPRRRSRRTLYIEYWSRTDECKERKWDHLDEITEKYGTAEEHIFATTLKGRTAFLEPNMFPYDTPAGIEHWTLWHVKDLNHEQVKQYVENWIDANAPHVERWNYDDNPERSIDIFHVHVYFQVAEGLTVLQDRKVEDLVHELD